MSDTGAARSTNPDAALINALHTRLRTALRHALPRATSVALLDFPHHNNVGDTAIWAGERSLLDELGCDVVSVADEATYEGRKVRAALGSDGVALLHGGGSFGDLWPLRQAFRERVIRDLPNHNVLQMPQTVSINEARGLTTTRKVIEGHGGVTVLVRDHPSARVCLEQLGLRAEVVPDAAFALGELTRPRPARIPVLCLARTDHERAFSRPDEREGVEVRDWFDGVTRSRLRRRLQVRSRTLLLGQLSRFPVARQLIGPGWQSTFDLLAGRRLRKGVNLLSRGEIVVTDRLHGHILSLLLGLPHVVVDSRRGKTSGFIDAFTRDSALLYRADDFQRAFDLATSLGRGSAAGEAQSEAAGRQRASSPGETA